MVLNVYITLSSISCLVSSFELEHLHSFNRELGTKIEELELRNNECLLEANIMPTNNIQKNITNFCNYHSIYSLAKQRLRSSEKVSPLFLAH